MSEDQTQPVVAEEATIKRAIKMSMFGSSTAKGRLELAAAQLKADGKDPATATPVTLGQIAGRIASVDVKDIVQGDGTISELWSGVGEFEAVIYETGQLIESPSANLPRYYLEGVKALLDGGAQAVVCGIEIVLVATGKQIPIAYEVRNLIPREADNPINRVKAAMQRAGNLRLPAPVAVAQLEAPQEAPQDAPEPSISDQARADKPARQRAASAA